MKIFTKSLLFEVVGDILSSIEIYDPRYSTWEQYAHLESPRSGVKAVVLEGRIYVLGGYNGTRNKNFHIFQVGLQ